MSKSKALIVSVIALIMALFHLYSGGIEIFPALQQRGVHFGLAIALIFILYPVKRFKEKTKTKSFFTIIDYLLAVCAIVVGFYVFTDFITISTSLSNPTSFMFYISIIGIILTLEASRRIMGWALPILSLIFLVYAFFGENLPILFAHSGYSVERIVTQIGLSSAGIFGVSLGVSATYVVLFIIFGTFLERSGGGQLLIDLAFSMVGRFRGGAAKVAVVASALTGSVNGYAVSNVATTGVLTIPLIKKSGYSARYAGAVESAASTGSMILPPVMGAVAFLMADFLQIEYYKVALAATIPAILYFIAIFIMVDLRAARIEADMKKDLKVESVKGVLLEKGHLIIPLIVLVYLLLIEQVNPSYAAFWGIVTVPFASLLRKNTWMSFRDIGEALTQGVKLSLIVVAACACAGIVIGVIDLTGLGLRLSGILVELSSGNLFILLVLTMLASIIMGMGLPPVACYIILAVIAAPAITQLGVGAMAAHLFIFYYGSLSAITPPVAIAAYTASGIARSNPLQTSITSVRLAAVAFIIPFMFIYGPELILQEGNIFTISIAVITALIGIFSLSVSLEGYLKREVRKITRILLFISALLSMSVGIVTDLIGIAIFVSVLFYELKIRDFEASSVNIKNA